MSLQAVVRNEYSEPFFEATSREKLMLRFSPSSGEWSDPTARVCSFTQADDLIWKESTGRGKLISWTIKPGRTRDGISTPDTVIGLVELEEGPWLALLLPNVDQNKLQTNVAIVIGFQTPENSETLPIALLG